MTPQFWGTVGRSGCPLCRGAGEGQGRGQKHVCDMCAYDHIQDLRLRLEAAREALKQAAMDLCPHCGVHQERERRNNHWCHPDEGVVCAASDIWDRRERLEDTHG